ncbi:4-(cytidine 5'-diphospho)-2-C-methyl-D-erythritol kinase [Rubricoccus marinus]|uniref:4-diphosphocytidyl-2-C-methyl-D-erythritol kinase n=1 Tax=Rubricoccus marinus TaxID=716817 RepID=A0A259TZH2_9BACT|nr:4-(cytidine 5'-diphospho)-2-C-methyl-D-erythritol kinase [Rubricoccus marinus]OZC03086.1 4-(cytidine 5'-diphospho)-2-C-methyl-D-erythritol kinase [Rubricoccus marinus]
MPIARSAPAKVNVGLRVLRKRPDGYHELESVFLPLEWADRVTARASEGLSLTCSDPALPTDRGNLVWRAAEALADWAGIPPLAALHLDKHVPYGAGLGSGSSDAAAALRLLADLWRLDVPPEAMHRLAAGLGADVPFFLLDGPAIATGTGTDLRLLAGEQGRPYRCPFTLVVAVPDVHVPTAEAYGWITPEASPHPPLADAVRSNDLERWRREVTNSFEAPVVQRFPAVGEVRDALLNAGAGWAALSGSGSSVVAAFESLEAAQSGAERVGTGGARVHVQPPGAEGAGA